MTNISWIDAILPNGIEKNKSILISGPGGTGKPLVELAFVYAWLKAGGSVIGIPLQYPSLEMLDDVMLKLYHLDVKAFKKQIAYIQFNPMISDIKVINEHIISANLVYPQVWNEAIEKASKIVKKSDLGTLVFGSALNLLFFSPIYKDETLINLTYTLKNTKNLTYLFTASTSVFSDEIQVLENSADYLMLTRIEKPKKLYFKVVKANHDTFSDQEILVPIDEETLDEISQIAGKTRKKLIQEIINVK